MSMQTTMRSAYIALGSNLGNREQNLKQALDLLSAADGCSVAAVGPFIDYPAEGSRPGAPQYLNSAAELGTELNPSRCRPPCSASSRKWAAPRRRTASSTRTG